MCCREIPATVRERAAAICASPTPRAKAITSGEEAAIIAITITITTP
jgi:hypothetical protein